MGQLSQDMAKLTQEIIDTRTKRLDFVQQLQGNAEKMKSDTTNLLQAMRSDLADIKKYIQDFKADCRHERDESRKKAQAEFQAFKKRLALEVSAVQADVQQQLQSFRQNRVQMASETKAELEAFHHSISQFVNDLRVRLRKEQATACQEASAERKKVLGEVHRSLKNMQADFREDLLQMRNIWNGASHQSTTGAESAQQKDEPVQDENVAEPSSSFDRPAAEAAPVWETSEPGVASDVEQDDLMQISGIGQGRQNMFYEAGIFTFSQLAELSPEDVQTRIGESAPKSTIQKWIDQAKELKQ